MNTLLNSVFHLRRSLVLAIVLIGHSLLAQTVDVLQTSHPHWRYLSGCEYMQEFQPSANGSISRIDVQIENGCWGGYTVDVEVYDGSGDGGTLLGTSQAISLGNCLDGWREFNFTAFPVTSGNTYTIKVGGSGSSGFFAVGYANSDLYSGGDFLSGTSPSTQDMAFETYLGPGILPVEFASFDATTSNDGVLLEWATVSEKDNDYFEIQKSTDLDSWETIEEVEGNGTTNNLTKYSYGDNQPSDGTNYYRLRQVDYDGTEDFSKVVVTNYQSQVGSISLFPNPTNSKLYVDAHETAHIEIRCAKGVDYSDKIVVTTIYDEQVQICVEQLPEGIYLLLLEGQIERFQKN